MNKDRNKPSKRRFRRIQLLRFHGNSDLIDLTPRHSNFLFHYTKIDALKEILTRSTLRLTDYRFFNDSTESEHAYQVLEGFIEEREKAKSRPPIERWALREIANRLPEIKNTRKYVICFSTKPDDLNQWRSYASPGAGFCMGFETSSLINLAYQYDGLLGECIYEEERQKQIILRLLDSTTSGLENYFPCFCPGEINSDLAAATARKFVHNFIKIAPMFKNSAFRDESEVRLVLEKRKDSTIGFRSGTHTLIPYQEISLKQDEDIVFPSSVYIKTSREPELAKIGLEEFLIEHKMSSDIVTNSNIPYRETI